MPSTTVWFRGFLSLILLLAASSQFLYLRWPFLLLSLVIFVFVWSFISLRKHSFDEQTHPTESSKESTSLDSEIPVLYHPPQIHISEQPQSPEITKTLAHASVQIEAVHVKQPYDAFLVLDVEATCLPCVGFDWPNEIIEWPVCLLRWKNTSAKAQTSQLEVVDEFRSFVKPTWRPQLSPFCSDLTGITQAQVAVAPTFPKVLKMFAAFLTRHGLIDPKNGRPMQRFCWCSDGPFDIRDFVVKQCFISNIPMPLWLRGDVLDVRRVVSVCAVARGVHDRERGKTWVATNRRVRSLNIPQQLRALGLGPFQGRAHCGIDDTRNVARIVIELARRGVRLEPNTPINPNRRWQWMGGPGEVLEHCLL
ncbi:ribonuclease H-like domain-containing protein [Phlebopus sp. FC_14]|nr:ribonuclease H-like domain-containing protein [Phlebopus sp. FC_14]